MFNKTPFAIFSDVVSKLNSGSSGFLNQVRAVATIPIVESIGEAILIIGFIIDARVIPRRGYKIVNIHGNQIGVVTSGTQSPTLSIGIGLGYISKSYSKIGTKIAILIRGKNCPAHIVKLPFIKT